jgi:hypothetical protein
VTFFFLFFSLNQSDLRRAGVLDFEFVGEEEILRVHVFRIDAGVFQGQEPTESEEMKPCWFEISREYLRKHGILTQDDLAENGNENTETDCGIPFDQMWLDDRHWFPLLLAGKIFQGYFLFKGHEEILTIDLKEMQQQ